MADGNGNGKVIPLTRELLFAWGFRGLLSLVTAIGLYFLDDLKKVAETIAADVRSHDTKLEIINDRITGVRETLQDHETRLRSIEQRPNGR